MDYAQEKALTAYIENMLADTEYKRGLLKYEPWKLVITAFGAGAAVTIAMLALATFVLSHLR